MSARTDDLTTRAEALAEALRVGGERLDPDHSDAAAAALAKMQGRLAIDSDHTVVVLAGATGSGKSSLFNALAQSAITRVGVRRPTTGSATAAVWGEEPADPLLDWLHVPARHRVGATATPLDGLVLLDLPDIDSTAADHRIEADRVIELADAFVWVTDPQKYADAVLHQQYLAAVAARRPAMIVALNQADRIAPDLRDQVVDDLRRLVRTDGGDDVTVLATSAVDAPGVGRLRTAIEKVVAGKQAARRRLRGDVRVSAADLRTGVADRELRLASADDALVDALADVAGVDAVVHAVERDYRLKSAAHGGWPFTRWTRRLRPDPLRRLGLSSGTLRRDVDPAGDGDPDHPRRSSLPPPSAPQRARMELALRDLGDRAGRDLPLRWAQAAERAAEPARGTLTDRLDQAVTSASLRTRRPLWWPVVSVLQWVFAVALLAGAAWLAVLVVLGWAQIHVSTPSWGPLPYPLLLVAAGVGLGLLTAAVARWAAARGAHRRGARVRARLRGAIADATDDLVLAPVRAVLADHQRVRELLDTAAR